MLLENFKAKFGWVKLKWNKVPDWVNEIGEREYSHSGRKYGVKTYLTGNTYTYKILWVPGREQGNVDRLVFKRKR